MPRYLNLLEEEKKFTNGDVINQNDVFFSQTNPYFGLRYKLKENLISIKYYLPKVLTSAGSLSSLNQFSYGEISLKIPFKSNSADKIEKEEKSDEEAFKEVQALKSGILLVVLSGSSSKDVKDRVADQLIVEAFKSYSFSKFFIVDDSDIDSLRRTNRIAVYENYPFVEKQTINLENFTWFTINAGKANITERKQRNI